jgi:hypothetical protein
MGTSDRSCGGAYRGAAATAHRSADDCTFHGASSGLREAFSDRHRCFDAKKQQ